MTTTQADLAELESMIDTVQRIRNRTCEPKANTNPRYLALSNVVTHLRKAVDDLRTDL